MNQQHARQYSFAEAQWKRIEDLLPTELVTRNCLKRGSADMVQARTCWEFPLRDCPQTLNE